MQRVWLCPIAIFSCLLPVFRFQGIKKRTGGIALCVGFIAEELKPPRNLPKLYFRHYSGGLALPHI